MTKHTYSDIFAIIKESSQAHFLYSRDDLLVQQVTIHITNTSSDFILCAYEVVTFLYCIQSVEHLSEGIINEMSLQISASKHSHYQFIRQAADDARLDSMMRSVFSSFCVWQFAMNTPPTKHPTNHHIYTSVARKVSPAKRLFLNIHEKRIFA